MRLSTRLRVALLAWFVLETFVFAWVVHLIGGAGALLLTLLGSLFGWTMLKRAGVSALDKLRTVVDGRMGAPERRHFVDETLTTIGALGLLLPGFLSDVVGIVLAIPAARRKIAAVLIRRLPQRPSPAGKRANVSTIDLDPGDWHHKESSAPSPRIVGKDEI